jgi:hypothetical protein
LRAWWRHTSPSYISCQDFEGTARCAPAQIYMKPLALESLEDQAGVLALKSKLLKRATLTFLTLATLHIGIDDRGINYIGGVCPRSIQDYTCLH